RRAEGKAALHFELLVLDLELSDAEIRERDHRAGRDAPALTDPDDSRSERRDLDAERRKEVDDMIESAPPRLDVGLGDQLVIPRAERAAETDVGRIEAQGGLPQRVGADLDLTGDVHPVEGGPESARPGVVTVGPMEGLGDLA